MSQVYVLLYQAGIANVFKVDAATEAVEGRNAERRMQADFRSCENFARGIQEAGGKVYTMAANVAGDSANVPWTFAIEDAPFSESFHPVGTYSSMNQQENF